jgi:hypothetical protein
MSVAGGKKFTDCLDKKTGGENLDSIVEMQT